ncbi:MAG: chromophore lyase CpcT/CpeT [Phycisphaerales bacterium]
MTTSPVRSLSPSLVCITLAAGFIPSISGCAWFPESAKADQSFEINERPSIGMMRFEQHLTGSFSSRTQSIADPEFYEIVLNMVPIWEDRDDGPWLYVEQAVAEASDRPYRQRVYHLMQTGDNEYMSTVYSFENAMDYAGAYTSPQPLASLTPDDLSMRIGCAITVQWDHHAQAFIGSTNSKDCESNLRASTYATSEVYLHKDRLITWDRGYNDMDEQVWGAVKGGYTFDRVQ